MTSFLLGLSLAAAEPVVQTVLGPVPVSQLGRVLIHEHVLVDFGGADVASPARYDADEVFALLKPRLDDVKTAGIDTVVECTPQHLGRDPGLLVRLSRSTGVHLVSNTGLYQGKYCRLGADATVDELAADWVAEARGGLDGTAVRPGFIKIAVDGPPISALQQRIVRAAARCSKTTGLPITMHCPKGRSALQALDILTEEGVPPGRLIVAHADAEADTALHDAIAERGAWLSFDGLREPKAEAKRGLVVATYRKHPDRLLLSQDAGWYHVGEPNGGNIVPFDWLPRVFLPSLREGGLGEADIERLMMTNPQAALSRAITLP